MASQVTIVDAQQRFKKTPAGKIPVDWELTSFGDAFHFLPTANNSRADLNATGDLGYIHYGDIHTKWRTTLRCDREALPRINRSLVGKAVAELRDGDLVMADASEDYEGLGIAVEVRGVGAQKIIAGLHALVLRDKGGQFADGFRGYIQYMPAIRQQVVEVATGVSVFGLSKGNLSRVLIPRPPLDEQRKIAEILSSVDEAIERTSGVLEAVQKLRVALVNELFSVGAGQKKVGQTQIGRLPVDWELVPCAELCEVVTVGIVVKPARLYAASGVPCLRSSNIREGEINAADLVYISPEANEAHAKSRLKAGDVVAVRTGYPGTSCVIPEHFASSNCVDLIILRPGPRVNSSFLSRFINSPAGRRQVLRGQGGLAQQHFNVSEAAKLLVPVPPMEEQARIVSILESTDALISKEAALRTRYANLRKGLMASLLTGKVRV